MTFDPTPTSGARPLQDTTGAYVYLRDLVEAMTQRWNRYVIGYDLKTQVRIFEDMTRRYERARRSAGFDRGVMERVTRGPVVAGILLVAALAAYILWKRRRAPRDKRTGESGEPKVDPKLEAATALYRSLEIALAAQGISRPASLPPLKHAEDLAARAHPLADDVLELTQKYLEARFGGAALDDASARAFEKRVKEIRSYKAPPQAPLSAP